MRTNRIYIILGLAVLVGAVAYVNYLLNKPGDSQEALNAQSQVALGDQGEFIQDPQQTGSATQGSQSYAGEEDYYAVFRADRDSVRAKEIEYLDAIVNEESTDESIKNEAQEQKLNLVSYMDKEVTIEGLLKAKGFSDAAVTIQKGSVNVVVEAAQLEDAQVAQILDIVQSESGESAKNIKVMPRETSGAQVLPSAAIMAEEEIK